MTWIVVDVGCIECGADSGIVGVYTDKAVADRIAERLCDVRGFIGEQHEYVVFPMPELNATGAVYSAALEQSEAETATTDENISPPEMFSSVVAEKPNDF